MREVHALDQLWDRGLCNQLYLVVCRPPPPPWARRTILWSYLNLIRHLITDGDANEATTSHRGVEPADPPVGRGCTTAVGSCTTASEYPPPRNMPRLSDVVRHGILRVHVPSGAACPLCECISRQKSQITRDFAFALTP